MAENHHCRLETAIVCRWRHIQTIWYQLLNSGTRLAIIVRVKEAAMKKNHFGIAILTGALMLMGLTVTASTANAQRIGFGVTFGPGYYAPPPVVAYAPVAPYPGYIWTDGYYNPYGVWVNGFWGPRYGYGRYYGGYGRGFVGGRGFGGGRAFVGGRGFGGRGYGGWRGHR